MKSFKKALAVMLAVLMVVFSFPFSAMALDNPYKDEGIYAEDYDVELHVYVSNYDMQYGYGYGSDVVQFFDASQTLKKSDLSSPDGCFAFIVCIENLDQAEVIQTMFDVDWTKVECAEYGRRDALATGTNAENMALETWKDYNRTVDTTGTENKHVTGVQLVSCVLNGATPDTQTQQADTNGTFDGQLLAIFGYRMLDDVDEINLKEVFNFHVNDYDSPVICQVGNDNMNIVPYGAVDAFGNPVKSTTYIFPEWGVGPADEPTTVDYVYTMADGVTKKTVTVNKGETPTAPANTADTAAVSNNNGTHTHTTYSWPEFSADVTAYTEVATPVTDNCNLVANDDAVAPGHTTDGSKASSTCSVCGYTKAGDVDPATGHTWDAGVVTAATCVAKGYTTYTCTANDGGELVTDYTDIDPTNHANVVTDAAVDPTCEGTGLTEGSHCAACNTVIKAQETVPAAGHKYDTVVSSTDATCVTPGSVTKECTECGKQTTETGVLDPTNHEGNIVDAGNDKAATCKEEGYTGDKVCDACNEIAVKGETIPVDANNHVGDTYLVGEAAASCDKEGYTGDTYCADCDTKIADGEKIDMIPHTEKTIPGKEATRAEAGYTESVVCDVCGTVIKEAEVIEALGVMVTVTTNELGSTTLNGVATTGEAQKVAYASDYTLTATANAGAEFVGWMVNGKMVSTDATYTTAAYADTTYAPVFAETENTFTVTFVDVFNNVIAVLSADEVAALTELPAPYAVSGYTFTGYDKTLEEVKALEASAVVTAAFEKNAEEVYNVSAPGCAIYVNGVLADGDSVMVPHDARVAVMPANDDVATSWTVNGAEAAYGEKYTFYVTTDVTVSYSTADVNVAPTVVAVNGNGEKVEGTNKVRFLASRTVTAGYELVESGFVYGKNIAVEDATEALTLENVGNGCYLYKNSNMAADGQFALTFGVSNGTACARAYMIVKNTATGETSVVYAAPQING